MATKSSPLSASLEDYLEAILRITRQRQVARAKEIAAMLGVNNSSVTGALRTLADRGLVNYAPYDWITLTPEGEAQAAEIFRRHEALRDFFIKVLHIDPQTADEGACKVEHGIPPAIVDRLIQFADYIETCPQAGANWVQGFGYFCRSSNGCSGPAAQCSLCGSQGLSSEQVISAAKPGRTIPLDQALAGQLGTVIQVEGDEKLRERLRTLDLDKGAVVRIEKLSPTEDQVEIKVRGYHRHLTRYEAMAVLVEMIDPKQDQPGSS